MGIRIGILGAGGSFAQCFIPLFKAHPDVAEVVLCDASAEKLATAAQRHGIGHTLDSFDALLSSDVDAVAVITQHWLHAPQAIQALQAGKHVYSAVPAAVTEADLRALVQAVIAAGRIYMLGETSYYYPEAIYCRQRLGEFGHIVYGEAEYLHDWDHGLYEVYQHRRGPEWRQLSGDPPMYYCSHSVGMLISVTGAHATAVSCHGFGDRKQEDRDLYRPDNRWSNVFSSQTALLTLSDGSSARINEFRRVGHVGATRMSLFGTEATFEHNTAASTWITKHHHESLNDLLRCPHNGLSAVHPAERLPASFQGLPNGHEGSHQFLVDDFVRSCVTGALPPNNVWQAARYTFPGLVAHQSALQAGALLPVPDLGDAPAHWSPRPSRTA